MKIIITIIVISYYFPLIAFAFQMDSWAKPDPSAPDHYVDNIHIPTLPIHEHITEQVIGKFDGKINVHHAVAGVRWNDDPLGQLGRWSPKIISWGVGFEHSCRKNTPPDKNYDLLYRSHCGDLQLLHAMASSQDEPAEDSYQKVMMWLEFTYKVATGLIEHNRAFESITLDDIEDEPDHFARMSGRSAELFDEFILSDRKRRMRWQPEYMFTLDCYRIPLIDFIFCDEEENHDPNKIQDMALGSAFHVIQDSYSASHVSRELDQNPAQLYSIVSNRGRIKAFYYYNSQDSSKHGSADGQFEDNPPDELESTTGMYEVLEFIASQVIYDRENSSDSWEKVVKPKLNEVAYKLVDPAALPPDNGKYH